MSPGFVRGPVVAYDVLSYTPLNGLAVRLFILEDDSADGWLSCGSEIRGGDYGWLGFGWVCGECGALR